MSAVVVVSHRTTSAQQDALDAACLRAGVSCVHWHLGDAPLSDPSLVVAGLGVGERFIPSDVVELVDAVGGSATLLLLTNEPLVRPAVTLQGGRVVVMAESQRAERLYRHVRMLARATPGERERVQPSSWSAELSAAEPVSNVDERGLTAIVPLEGELEASTRVAVENALHGGDVDESRLHELLAGNAGLVHLSVDASSWRVYWPPRQPSAGALWLHSSSRLPSLYDLRIAAAAAHPRVLRLGAHSGDTLLALSSAAPLRDDAVARAMAEGGPGLLARLREHEQTSWGQKQLRGLVAEVR